MLLYHIFLKFATKKEIINIPTNEIKTFEEKTPEEYFDELNKTQDKHEKFEEYTKEFDNIIIEKGEGHNINGLDFIAIICNDCKKVYGFNDVNYKPNCSKEL